MRAAVLGLWLLLAFPANGEEAHYLVAGGEPIATVLAGDFNTWSSRETTLLRLREQFPDSPPPLEEGTHGAFPTDHVLFRAGSGGITLRENSYSRLEESHHSDHHPIQVGVRFGD